DVDRNVEIARRSAQQARAALARHAKPRAVLHALRNAHLDRVSSRYAPIAVTGRANVLEPALAFAARTSKTELHRARHLRDGSFAFTLRTHGGAGAGFAAAMARFARVV